MTDFVVIRAGGPAVKVPPVSTPPAVILKHSVPTILMTRGQPQPAIVMQRIGGPSGGSPFVAEFLAATQWTVNHNLGRQPASVAVLTTGGVEIESNVTHLNDNQLIVDLNPAVAGRVVVQ